MIIKAIGDPFTFDLAQYQYLHGLQGKIFSNEFGQAVFLGGRDVLIKKAKIIVVGLRGPRKSPQTTNTTLLQIEASLNPSPLAAFIAQSELDQWTDINEVVRADTVGNNWQLKVKEGVQVPQYVYIDNENALDIYESRQCYCELQLDVEGVQINV